MRILLAEDEVKLALALRHRLQQDGHWVDLVTDGDVVMRRARDEDYEAVLLDVMLPGTDGLTICRTLRERAQWMPILMITARDDVRDRVRGLDAGADDYLIKPFAFAELVARLRAILRRSPAERPAKLVLDGLVLDPATRTVSREGRLIPLSTREWALLEFLVRRRGTAVGRAQITRHVWGHDHDSTSNVTDVYVGYLRRKLDVPGRETVIRTVRGIGYQVGTP
ncbi:MAG: two component transcriptional regulator, winged helix family [Amycolatopsis sp.]|uniref:response regulator transcription factor n=1 Tax=Amycolatopsis sp. TaxID=37632 RepID=UPI00261387D5|nr:response regulator transcription factor [Amycolatopsis sp.]MCU1680654.1 two component transcriptional regulator, winged helix family [Amycolatopsis sp.]